MNVHVLQHVAFEDIGSMKDWLDAKNADVTYTRFYESAELPLLDNLDLIIAMGGPMSVNDEEELPWLVAEKQFVREAIERGIPTIGICLGAQLMASAMGARVYPGKKKEIGWFPITAVANTSDAFRFPQETTVFHWHGETFDLPAGAVHLARSKGCEHQAFQLGRNAFGLQFHLETTPQSLDAIMTNCRNELVNGEFIQSEAALRNTTKEQFLSVNKLMAEVLEYTTKRQADCISL